jgi:hypothetical protein
MAWVEMKTQLHIFEKSETFVKFCVYIVTPTLAVIPTYTTNGLLMVKHLRISSYMTLQLLQSEFPYI